MVAHVDVHVKYIQIEQKQEGNFKSKYLYFQNINNIHQKIKTLLFMKMKDIKTVQNFTHLDFYT